MCEVRSVKSERNGFMWTVICDMSSCLAADINIVFTASRHIKHIIALCMLAVTQQMQLQRGM